MPARRADRDTAAVTERRPAFRRDGARWVVAPEPIDATPLLRDYFTDVASRYHGRPATGAEVDAALAEDPSDDLARFLVGRYAGVPSGCVGLRWLGPDVTELTRLFVHPNARRTGGGHVLLEAAEDAARDLGARAMRLDTRHDLVEARALYAAHGYAEIPAYSHGPYADHWYEKVLGGDHLPSLPSRRVTGDLA